MTAGPAAPAAGPSLAGLAACAAAVSERLARGLVPACDPATVRATLTAALACARRRAAGPRGTQPSSQPGRPRVRWWRWARSSRLDLGDGYDPGGRVERIGDGTVWFDADGDRFGYALHDGTGILP